MPSSIRLRRQFAALTLAVAHATCASASDEIVIDDQGRRIQLNQDGTWSLLSSDRFATNEAGERIRIRPDGTWSLAISTATPEPDHPGAQRPIPVASGVTVFLANVEIQRRTIKRPKSRHAETRTIFTLRLLNNSNREVATSGTLKDHMIASSSRGSEFDIESVSSLSPTIKSGEQTDITVTALGSPQWFGVKFLSLELAEGSIASLPRTVLHKDMDDVVRTDVENFY